MRTRWLSTCAQKECRGPYTRRNDTVNTLNNIPERARLWYRSNVDPREVFDWVMIALLPVLLILAPAFVSWLWNRLMPDIFGLPTINYWQALGLMVLSNCFFYRSSRRKR